MGQIIPGTLEGTGHFQRWAHHALDIMNYGQNECSPPDRRSLTTRQPDSRSQRHLYGTVQLVAGTDHHKRYKSRGYFFSPVPMSIAHDRKISKFRFQCKYFELA